jgi:C-terminal processing protease CtpA/Prc
MKKLLFLTAVLAAGLFSACQTDDENHVPSDLRINNFIWKGLNEYYLWQADVPDLADDRFANQGQLNDFLRQYPDHFEFFDHLRVDPSIDRFSVLFSDYTELEGILSGTTKNNGVDFGLRYKSGSSTDIFGWVRYILPDSDASSKDIQRGDIFYAVNGTPLTVDNYQALLGADTYTLNLADYAGGNITPNGQSVTLTKQAYSENPVYQATVIPQGSHNIGYLVYNGFYPDFETQLNNAFAQFQAQGVTDLVLDLRYNSGGSIDTARRLASMVTGQFNGQVFARESWNAKAQAYFEANNPAGLTDSFTDALGNGTAINSLNLTKVYILTSKSTASASELVINGLAPYIDVVQIGDNTVGKNVGSITMYDSPDFSKHNVNPDHKYAMQPIVLKLVNAAGFGDYQVNGLTPDVPLTESLGNLPPLGDLGEPLLASAINLITASGRQMPQSPEMQSAPFMDSKSIDGLRDQMYKTR